MRGRVPRMGRRRWQGPGRGDLGPTLPRPCTRTRKAAATHGGSAGDPGEELLGRHQRLFGLGGACCHPSGPGSGSHKSGCGGTRVLRGGASGSCPQGHQERPSSSGAQNQPGAVVWAMCLARMGLAVGEGHAAWGQPTGSTKGPRCPQVGCSAGPCQWPWQLEVPAPLHPFPADPRLFPPFPSHQVLESPWKPAWWRHHHPQKPCGILWPAPGWLRAASPLLLVPDLCGLQDAAGRLQCPCLCCCVPGVAAGSDPSGPAKPRESFEGCTKKTHTTTTTTTKRNKVESPIVLLLIVPFVKVIFRSFFPTFIHNSGCTGLMLLVGAQVAWR